MSAAVQGPVHPGHPPARNTIIAAAVLVLILVIGLGGYLVYQLARLPKEQCLAGDHLLPDPRFVAVGLVALLVGRYAAGLRFLIGWEATRTAPGDRPPQRSGGLAVALFFLILALIFVYEATGTYQPPAAGLEPITFYTRCAIWEDTSITGGAWSMIVIATISFLYGHWLWAWHPRSQKRGSFRLSIANLIHDLATRDPHVLFEDDSVDSTREQPT